MQLNQNNIKIKHLFSKTCLLLPTTVHIPIPFAISSSSSSEPSPDQIQVLDGVSRIKTSSELRDTANSPTCSALMSSGQVPGVKNQ